MKEIWKRITKKMVYQNPWMDVTEEKVQTPSGKELIYGLIYKKPAVLTVPWDGTHMTLVGQYRFIIDAYSWEFPMGHSATKNLLMDAQRELLEEAGLVAVEWNEIGRFSVANGCMNQIVVVFFAKGLTIKTPQHEVAEERMQIRRVTLDDFRRMIIDGEILDGPTLAAFSICTTRGVFDVL